MSDPVVLLSTGDVVGPAGGVTNNSMVLFSGTSGKLIKGNNAVVTNAGLALLDDVDAAAQRVTLGLGTAATATLTTSGTDSTTGRVMKVGDFGYGTGVGPAVSLINTNLDLVNISGIYRITGVETNTPVSPLVGHVLEVLVWDNGTFYQNYYMFNGQRRFTRVIGQAWREIALTDSPAFTGTPTAPTASVGTNTTQVATTAFVATAEKLNAPIATVSAIGTINLTTGAPNTSQLAISGTGVNINGFTVDVGRCYFVRFAGALTLTNSASLVTQTGANITTASGDTCVIRAISANVVEILCGNFLSQRSVGVGQTWQNVAGSRSAGTTYTNTTGRPIEVIVVLVHPGALGTVTGTLSVGGVVVCNYGNTGIAGAVTRWSCTATVPNGATYGLSALSGMNIDSWVELR